MAPDFISVAYGANGSRCDRALRCTQHMVSTGLRTVGHLTCVAQSVADVEQMVADYAESRIDHILAIRGDMLGGAGQPWVAHPWGLPTLLSLSASSSGFTQRHASVERVRDMGCELFNVGALGLHHYTLNRSRATTELRTMLAWRRLERAGSPRNDEAIFAS